VHKKTKVHRDTPIYIFTNDNMDLISSQVQEFAEEVIEEATRKQVEQQQKVQDQLQHYNNSWK
jgi:hypothetical protein